MKKLISIRNVIIVILCITIICLGIGFIVLSLELKKAKNDMNHFDVTFTNISKTSSIKGGSIEPTGNAKVTSSNKVLELQLVLSNPGDEISYTALIKNNGNRNIKIVDVFLTPDYTDSAKIAAIAPITIQLSKVKGKVLEPEEEMAYKIIASFDSKGVAGKKTIPLRAVLVAEEAE